MNKHGDGPNSKPYIVINGSTIYPPEGTSITEDYSWQTAGMTNWRWQPCIPDSRGHCSVCCEPMGTAIHQHKIGNE